MIMQPQPQLNRIQQMNNMMQNVRRDDGLSNLMALQQMRQMRQPQMMQQPPQTMTYMAQGGFPDLSGDGTITQKDILMAKGVLEKNQGGLTSLPVVAAFGGFNPFKPLRRAAKSVGKGVRNLGGAASDAFKGITSGISNALGGGSGTSDFLKTLALMAVTNMLLPGSGFGGLLGGTASAPTIGTLGGRLALAGAKGYIIPSLATKGIKGVTSDPYSSNKLTSAALSMLGQYGTEKLGAGAAPESTSDKIGADRLYEGAGADVNMTPTDSQIAYNQPFPSGAEKLVDPTIKPNLAQRIAPELSSKVASAADTIKNVAGTNLAPDMFNTTYTPVNLGADALKSYGVSETTQAMDAAKKSYQDAQGLAAQIQAEAEGRQMTARQFAKAAIEDPVKYSYIYKYGDNPQSVQDILERMYQGTEDTQTAQYFEPATYTTESGRLPGELAAATGGGISSIINNARGQNNQFFQGQVPNTTRDNSDGMSDNETMLITDETGQKPKGIMKISEKEYVVSAPDMAILGNGDPNAGAQALDKFREGLRKAAYGTKAHQPRLNPRTALQSLANKAFG